MKQIQLLVLAQEFGCCVIHRICLRLFSKAATHTAKEKKKRGRGVRGVGLMALDT